LCAALWSLLVPCQAAKTPVAQGYGGAVASISEPASQAAMAILNSGGNAVDAAVAAAATLGVTAPFSCGVGGGGFMLIYLAKEQRVISIDHRETAPAAFHPAVFQADGKEIAWETAESSGAAVGVPGTVRGWHEALARYGTRTLQQVLIPAITVAERGFLVDANFHRLNRENEAKFGKFSSTSQLYLKDGKALAVGTLFKNPDLARTYRMIGQQGVRAFYHGKLAETMVETVTHPPTVPGVAVRGGYLTLADLANYESRIRLPLSTTYRGYEVVGMSLPSSGGATVGEALNILEGYDLAHMPREQAEHLYLEASRLAFADRNAYLADPEYVDVPLTGLLSKAYAAERRKLIDLNRVMLSNGAGNPAANPATNSAANPAGKVAPGDPYPFQQDQSVPLRPAGKNLALLPESLHTTHLTVADRQGNLVAYTYTIESWGGSGIVVPGHGFILNNEMTDFEFSGPHPNVPEGGKRPRSSMAPTIVLKDHKPVFTIGSPGGSTIISTVLQTIFNHIDLGLPLDLALAAPRMSQRNGGKTQIEPGFAASPAGAALARRGHQWLDEGEEIGAASALLLGPDGKISAISEPQRHGVGSALVQFTKQP
jgi:gamma-glutamyltranspeptidase/glutathione hydrolase